MFKNLFNLDLRSLALARVLLGILTFFDIYRRVPELDTFFTDAGLLPRWTLQQNFELNYSMSLLSLNGSYSFALFLAVIGMIASVTFALGWRTRLSNFIVWLTIISFQARFPEAATTGGDLLIKIFLFWSLFLPVSARYSIDRAVRETELPENEYKSIFTAAWIIQIFLLYFMTFLYKWAPVYHTTFDAVYYMLQLDHFTTPVGTWLGQYLGATRFLTFAAYALEIVGPIMILIPFKRDLFRGAAVVSFWLFHLGIGMTLHLGNFVPICLIIWVGLIPTAWWSYLSKKVTASTKKMMTLYYDGQSELARKIGVIAKELLILNSVKVLPSSVNPQMSAFITPENSFILVDEESKVVTTHSIFRRLLLISGLLPLRVLGKIVNSEMGLYLSEVKESGEVSLFSSKAVESKNNSNTFHKLKNVIGQIFEIVGFDNIKTKLNKFERFMGGFLLFLIIAWNIEGYVQDRKWSIGTPFDEIMFALNLSQGWAMFAPHPQRVDGWWVMDGTLSNGEKWDALNDKGVSFERPADMYDTYPTDNWRKFLDNIQGSRNGTYLNLLGNFLCRKWNANNQGDGALKSFKLYFMREFTTPPLSPPTPVEKVLLVDQTCF